MNHGIDNNQPSPLCHDGSIRGAVKAECGHPKMSIDQAVVKENVGHCFSQGSPHKESRLVGAHQQCIAYDVQIKEWQSPNADQQESDHDFSNVLIVDEGTKDHRGEGVSNHDPQDSNYQGYPNPMKEKLTDFFWK